MKLYRTVNYNHSSFGIYMIWSGSKREAMKNRADAADGDDISGVVVEEVNVPTAKPDLIAWLNDNLSSEGSV